ncbi:MAG: tail fiber domain-containing protein [Verrucomicrobiia bacterium]
MKNTHTQIIPFGALCALFISINIVCAQSTVFTYQGRVQDNGTNFNGTGQFKFALVTSTNSSHQATATANLSGTFVTSYNIVSGGSGYVSAPIVTVSGGGGSGATATAVMSGGVVTAINPGSAGSGYTSTPTVTLSAPPVNITYVTYWSNDGTSSAGSEPTTAVGLGVVNGLFTVALGDTTIANMTAINASIFAQPNLQLRIWFNDGVNGSAALSPVQNLTPAPYAVVANSANTALNATTATTAVTASGVAAAAVNTTAIANNAVTGAKIASGQVVKSLNTTLQDNVTLTGNSDITVFTGSGTLTLGTTATDANTASTIVKRDANGNFSAGSITLANQLYLPTTTASSGIIYSGGTPFIHSYGTLNFFGGVGAGNFTLSGGENVGIGPFALGVIASGGDNVAIGYGALQQNTGGSGNIAIGFNALANFTSGQNNIALGFGTGGSISTGNNNIDIGGNVGLPGDNNTIRIGGSSQTSTYIGGIAGVTVSLGSPVYINTTSGQLGTINSSQRFKQDIQTMGEASDLILALRPVTFRYKTELDPKGTPQFGLIAEEVDKVNPDLVLRDEKNQICTVRYEAINAMLLNEFLKEHRMVQTQDVEIQNLKIRLQKLEQSITAKDAGAK